MDTKPAIFGPTIGQTFSYVFGNFWTLLKVAGIPMVLLTGVMVYYYFPSLAHFVELAAEAEQSENPEMILGAFGTLFGSLFLILLVSLALYPSIATAIFRNIIHGQPAGFLTLDRGVLQMLGAMLVVAMIWMAGFFAISMAVGGVGGILMAIGGGSGSGGLFVLGIVVLYIGLIGGIFWLMAKTSLILPHVVGCGELRVGEAWRMTSGVIWPLIGTFIVIAILGSIISYILMAVAFMVGSIGADSSMMSDIMADETGLAVFNAFTELTKTPTGIVAMLIYATSMVISMGVNFGSLAFAYLNVQKVKESA